jgi:thiol-disulfide isomerase/thioredoxin
MELPMKFFKTKLIIMFLPLLLIAACSTINPKQDVNVESSNEISAPVSSEAVPVDTQIEQLDVPTDVMIESSPGESRDDPADPLDTVEANYEPTQDSQNGDPGELDDGSTSTLVPEATQEPIENPGEKPITGPQFFHYQFTDANSGKEFKISDFEGKVVLVETLAQWCSNCLRQQLEVYELHRILPDRESFVSIGIDIDPNEDLDMLKQYVKTNGFNWLYGVASAEVSREIANLLGAQYLNPPSTPMFIIDQDGNIHELRFGIKKADELKAELEQYLP